MTYTIAYYVYRQLGLEKVAILRANNRYGRFGVAQFRKGSIKLGKPAPIEINYEPNYDKVNPDFVDQIERLKKVSPDAVILWADAGAAGVLVKKIREARDEVPDPGLRAHRQSGISARLPAPLPRESSRPTRSIRTARTRNTWIL